MGAIGNVYIRSCSHVFFFRRPGTVRPTGSLHVTCFALVCPFWNSPVSNTYVRKIKLFLSVVALAGQYVRDMGCHLSNSCVHFTCSGCGKQVKHWPYESRYLTLSDWGSGSFSCLNQHMVDSFLTGENK